jgi:hypothetical protein
MAPKLWGAKKHASEVVCSIDQTFADRGQVELGALRDETLELWPREMAPGY